MKSALMASAGSVSVVAVVVQAARNIQQERIRSAIDDCSLLLIYFTPRLGESASV